MYLKANIFKRLIIVYTIMLMPLLGACQPADIELVVSINGQGTVSSDLQGAGCKNETSSSWCRTYAPQTQVTLSATPASGYEFVGWEAEHCRGLWTCALGIENTQQLIKAHFKPLSELEIVNSARDLRAVLEHGQLAGSCARYFSNPQGASDYIRLMCGKNMFFNEGFELLGVPQAIMHLLLNNAPQFSGPHFENFGLYANPYSRDNLPLGMVAGKQFSRVKSVAYGCASCHFAQTPDGRYTVGLPNHNYDYGKQILSLLFTPIMVFLQPLAPLFVAPSVREYLQPAAEEIANNIDLPALLELSLLIDLVPELGQFGVPSQEKQLQYLSWKPGTQDFVIDPVGLDDQAHTISKIPSLWNIIRPEQIEAMGGPAHAMLGATGSTVDLKHFLQGFIALSKGDEAIKDEHLLPLHDYLLSLEPPSREFALNAQAVNRGAALFTQTGCGDCHNGPSHHGLRTYSFAEIGSDQGLKYWLDANLDGIADIPALAEHGTTITHQLKAPRLLALWSYQRFLANGSVDSLEELLCVEKMRPQITAFAYADKGHLFGCDLSRAEKLDLVEYLYSL